jgi:archaeal flagellar protein FlaI
MGRKVVKNPIRKGVGSKKSSENKKQPVKATRKVRSKKSVTKKSTFNKKNQNKKSSSKLSQKNKLSNTKYNKLGKKPEYIFHDNPVYNLHLKQLCLHQEGKKEFIDVYKLNPGKSTVRNMIAFAKKQIDYIEQSMGLLHVDWDQLTYSDEGRKIISQEILKLNRDIQELTEQEKKILENILINLKMFYLLLREEVTFLEDKKFVDFEEIYQKQQDYLVRMVAALNEHKKEKVEEIIELYDFKSKDIPITIRVVKDSTEFIPLYDLVISSISKQSEYFLEKIRKELIKKVNLGIVDLTEVKNKAVVHEKFSDTIVSLLTKYFPDMDDETVDFLTTYLIQKSLGLGKVDLLMDDPFLEEIAINSATEPIWVYHRKYAWLKTTIMLDSEEQIRHYATMIGRKVGRQVTSLNPLLDASINKGDRVNATLMPISHRGNTITIRKTASKPWTITDLIKSKTISAETAAMIWLGMQYELSALIAGGTASGKTSMLNSIANLFPPNQRVLSIEDTREILLPKYIHWVPMLTRLPNAEGKGGITMLDLLVNSLRQRPDRILVGEIRRKKEAEVLFEAIHTGHSVYATVHANTTKDAITRLTSPPIEIPKTMLPAISMIIVQYRNRRTGARRTFQFSEIKENGDPNIIYQYDAKKDAQVLVNKSKALLETIQLFTGMNPAEVKKSIEEKAKVLRWMAEHTINDVDQVGKVVGEYYINPKNLLSFVKRNVPLR